MGWSYSFWRGSFYPKEVRPAEYLKEYSRHFDTVEVDYTFYRIPSETTLEKWKEQTSAGFLFSVKFPRVITHRKMLRDCEQDLEFFIERISMLSPKLGPLLLQLPPTFGRKNMPALEEFLPRLPKTHRYSIEVRNAQLLDSSLFSLLRRNEVALTIVVNHSIPEIEELTANFVYVRWEGDRTEIDGTLGRVEADRSDQIGVWAKKAKSFLKRDIELFGYFSKYYSGNPPSDADLLIRLLN